jgi:RNA polymerase sigma-70 factor (ECF subfamily)
MKHKILDVFRRAGREVALPEPGETEDVADTSLFHSGGGFREAPRAWADPEELVKERQFMAILEACIERMPKALGRVFLMREWLGLDAVEICKDLGVTSSNLFVMLHRARLRLRECIQANWLESAQS